MSKKRYVVEEAVPLLCYYTVEVDADSPEQAKKLGWKMICNGEAEFNTDYDIVGDREIIVYDGKGTILHQEEIYPDEL